MESKWYFFPGQTPENTKISDRAHALHITSEAWSGITQHLQRKQRIQEAIDREKAHREALKKGSEAMTKEWINSIENLRLRKEEERRDRINKKKEDKIQMFYKMRAEQEVVRKEYVDKVKKEAFMTTGHPKELTSALILSEILHGREKQREFNGKLRKHDEELKKKYDAEILSSDEQQRQQANEEKTKRFEEEKKVAQILRDQIKENEEAKKAANRAHIEKETQDRIKAAKEDELLKQFEIEEKKKKRREMAIERKKAIDRDLKRQQVLAKEKVEMELATQFYSEAKNRIDCLMKSKEKEMREEAIKHRFELAKKVAALQEAKDVAEDERIAKVIAERDAADKAKDEEKRVHEAQAVKDRIEDRKRYLQKLEVEKYTDNEMKRWELLNRCKAEEAIREYNEQIRRDKWAKMIEYRKELFEQMADDIETKKREKEIDEYLSRVSFEETDRMFFDYAKEVLELAKSKKRSTYPIEKVIYEYKKINSLLPKDRHCRCCKK